MALRAKEIWKFCCWKLPVSVFQIYSQPYKIYSVYLAVLVPTLGKALSHISNHLCHYLELLILILILIVQYMFALSYLC